MRRGSGDGRRHAHARRVCRLRQYFRHLSSERAAFPDIVFTACADLSADAASRQAELYTIQARGVEELLKSDDVDIVLNLTIPEAHAGVSLRAIEAGKHVYSEKPIATAVADGEAIIAAARAKGLRVGAAPDTVLAPGSRKRARSSTRAQSASR